MPRWGINGDQLFACPAGTLTNTFTDNQKLANLKHVNQFLLYVDYAQGDESGVEIMLEVSPAEDNGPPTEQFYLDVAVNVAGTVTPFTYKIASTGKYRIPLPVGVSEDRIRVSVRSYGPGPYPSSGSLNLFYSVK